MAVRIGVHDQHAVPQQPASHRAGPVSDRLPPDPMPKSLLLGAATLMGFTFLIAMSGNLERFNDPAVHRNGSVIPRMLTFADHSDGSISVLDGTTRATLHTLAPESNGFLRVVMRSLVRERRLSNLGADQPFLLYHSAADGRLLLEDPATGKVVGLSAFGRDNAGAFSALLAAK